MLTLVFVKCSFTLSVSRTWFSHNVLILVQNAKLRRWNFIVKSRWVKLTLPSSIVKSISMIRLLWLLLIFLLMDGRHVLSFFISFIDWLELWWLLFNFKRILLDRHRFLRFYCCWILSCTFLSILSWRFCTFWSCRLFLKLTGKSTSSKLSFQFLGSSHGR